MRVVLSAIDYADKSIDAIGEVDQLLVADAGRIYPREG